MFLIKKKKLACWKLNSNLANYIKQRAEIQTEPKMPKGRNKTKIKSRKQKTTLNSKTKNCKLE